MESSGRGTPWLFLALFLVASFLMIWRLEAMSAGGFEGTVLGTLVMPYCSGMGNLIFAFILGQTGGSGADVMTNSLVNNVTNMTLVLGLPAIIWGMNVLPKKNRRARRKNPKSTGRQEKAQSRRQRRQARIEPALAAAHADGGAVFHRRGLGPWPQRPAGFQRRPGAGGIISILAGACM